eukprot:TRINITY_DN1486_c0_g2_i1.p1 TRINITY_DN1486_c0_g2~~TRINITY_DN1486_c0_g2_i1.p1  ORF type:complete len:498 (+),score=107.33 TRINITY_DN1486_c0_g2_i1:119-1612(+)
MKEFVLEETFNISVTQFFNLFFESKEFKHNYHALRGDSDVDISDWTEDDQEGFTRVINFSSPISSNALIQKVAGGMNARCKESQVYNFVNGNNEFHVKSLTTFDGSTLGKSFFSSTEWQVKSSPPPPLSSPVIVKSSTYSALSRSYCNVKIIVKNEYKGRMFKGNIEGFVDDVARKSFTQWLDLVRDKLQELEKKKLPPIVSNNEDTVEKKPFQQHQAVKSFPPITTSTTQQQRHPEKHRENLSVDKSPFTQPYNLELPPTPKKEKGDAISWDSEQFSDSESDASSDTYYDAPEVWMDTLPGPNIGTYPTSSSPTTPLTTQYIPEGTPDYLNNFIMNINNEVNQLKSAIEVNHTRLVGLESAYAQHQRNTASNTEGHASASTPSTTHTSDHTIRNEGGLLGTCLSRIDNLVKLQQTEQAHAQERETYWKKKYEEMEEKVEKMKPGSSSKGLLPRSPLGILGLTVFLVLWPIVITKAWRYITPFKEVLFKRVKNVLGY